MKTMIMQNLGVTNKEDYGMLCYFLEWSIEICHLFKKLKCVFASVEFQK